MLKIRNDPLGLLANYIEWNRITFRVRCGFPGLYAAGDRMGMSWHVHNL